MKLLDRIKQWLEENEKSDIEKIQYEMFSQLPHEIKMQAAVMFMGFLLFVIMFFKFFAQTL